MKNFAKLYEFDDIGQVLVTIDETEEPGEKGPMIIVSFKPKGLGVCSIKMGKFGKDEDDAWDKAELAFKTIDEEGAYKTAKRVIDDYSRIFTEGDSNES